MLKSRDLYTHVEYTSLENNNDTIGQTITQYEVRAYADTRNLKQQKSFLITCTQRIIIPNPNQYFLGAANIPEFYNYPVAFTNSTQIIDAENNFAQPILLDYYPRTLNTAVASSLADATSNNVTLSQQYTVGSSTSQTNTFGISGSVGVQGDMPTADVGASAQYSITNENSRSLSSGNAIDNGTQVSNTNSMTIKDWGSYSYIDSENTFPSWAWAQEYPWDVMQYRQLTPTPSTSMPNAVILPAYVEQRLYDGTQVFPPSELSLLGVDFVARATWQLTPNSTFWAEDAKATLANPVGVTFQHTINYCSAQHGAVITSSSSPPSFFAALSKPITITNNSPMIDIPVLALDPITNASGPAIVGFVQSQFDVAPSNDGGAFTVTSESNNLLIRGSGFTDIMTTDFSAGAVDMTLYFKITDTRNDVTLSLKHWIAGSSGAACQLAIVVNGTTLTRFVDAPEAGSGGNNVTLVSLRCKDYTSVDFCDYLQRGLNTITIAIAPTTSGTTYQLSALAIG